MLELAEKGYITSTDLADYLVINIKCHLEMLIKSQQNSKFC